MAVVVAEGKVVVEADATGLPNKIADDIESNQQPVERSGGSLGRSIFGGVVGAWAAIGGTQAVVGWFAGAVTGASDLNETLSKSEQIFGTSSKTIELFGEKAARNIGLSKEAAIASAAGFGDLFTQLGFANDQAAALSQSTLTMAADLGSFNNMDTADVVERITAGFRGEYDSLQAVIPNINAARVAQEALDLGLVTSTVNTDKLIQAQTRADLAQRAYNEAVEKHGEGSDEAQRAGLALATANDAVAAAAAGSKDDITGAASAQAVLSIIQKDGARAMGDFARTSDGAANQTKIATASLEDQQAKIGGLLLPAWSGFLGILNDSVIPAISSTVDWMTQNTDTVVGLGIVIGGTAAALGIYTAAMAIHRAYSVASAAVTGGLTVAQWALNAAMSANPIGIVIVLIGALVAAIVWVATQTTFFQDAWANVTSFIGTAWQWLWDSVLNPVFTAIGAVFTWLYTNVISPIVTGILLYVGIWAAIFTWLYDTVLAPVFAGIGAVFTWLYANIIAPVVGYIQAYIQALGIVFTWLYANVISPVFAGIGTVFNWVWNNVINPVVQWITGGINLIGNTVRGVFEGIPGFFRSAFEAALGVVRGPVNGIISLINSAIGSLNQLSVTIPDWVPQVGGQRWGLNLPRIPMLARGTNNAPDMFIAGENGPELITGARGSTVRPYGATQDILARTSSEPASFVAGDLIINEAEDPLGTAGRIGAELRRWRMA